MMTRNALVLGLAVWLSIVSSPTYASGIPVFDAASKLENARQWAKEAKQWMETVEHYKAQMNAYKDQLATATGLRDIQGLLEQGKSLQSEIKTLQKQGISLNDLLTSDNPPSGALSGLYEKYKVFDVCDIKTKTVTEGAKNYLNVCKQETANKGYMIEQTAEVQKKVNEALKDIGNLSNRIANAKDNKESQDLANAIQAKSVQLNSLTSAWEMNIKAAEQRDKLLAAKREKAFRQQQFDAPLPKFGDLVP
ncbi:type IV secretion system protein [Serratia symbiotica]|uniref:TriD conjugal transfer protein n=3 Tax=Serratia symbiotica TaxID=138074 RepID=A0A455VNA2_9GAMM|nr:type IV secretion system protein [Serratia symbiotica]BBI93020.1 triD conjugal transfer protein [Serratia symbiotica]